MLDSLTEDDIRVGIFVVVVVLVLLAGIVEVRALFVEEDGCVIDESQSFETASDAALACRRVVAIGKALSAVETVIDVFKSWLRGTVLHGIDTV